MDWGYRAVPGTKMSPKEFDDKVKRRYELLVDVMTDRASETNSNELHAILSLVLYRIAKLEIEMEIAAKTIVSLKQALAFDKAKNPPEEEWN